MSPYVLETRAVYMRRADDCLRCVVASVLDVPYEDTPAIVPDSVPNADWWNRWYDWLDALGIIYDWVEVADGIQEVAWIAIVPSTTMEGRGHAVAMHFDELWFDPARERTHVDLDEIGECLVLTRRFA